MRQFYGSVIIERQQVVSDQETVQERDGRFFILLQDGTSREEVTRMTLPEYNNCRPAREYVRQHCFVTK